MSIGLARFFPRNKTKQHQQPGPRTGLFARLTRKPPSQSPTDPENEIADEQNDFHQTANAGDQIAGVGAKTTKRRVNRYLTGDPLGDPMAAFSHPNFPHNTKFLHDHYDHGQTYEGRGPVKGRFATDLIRLSAGLTVAGLFGLMIARPLISDDLGDTLARAQKITAVATTERDCAPGAGVLTADFTDFENVLSISPLGGVTAPGENLPAPYISINTKTTGTLFERRPTPVRAAADAEIIAIERHAVLDKSGGKPEITWSVHYKPCKAITVVYDRLDTIKASLLERSGGLSTFTEINGPTHLVKQTSIKVSAGEKLGIADGFDVALHDASSEQQQLARPERYRTNIHARAELFDVSPTLLATITPDVTKARCALDYLRREEDRDAWSSKIGDAWGIRRARGDNACRTALIDLAGTAQGAWYTDAAHNGATTKVSAIALAPDSIDPDRQIFALHGRLSSLTSSMIATPSQAALAAKTGLPDDHNVASAERLSDIFLTFEKGRGRINVAFDEIRDNGLYCYQDLRVKFVGPKMRGVIILQKALSATGGEILKIEARDDITSCANLSDAIELSANATGFSVSLDLAKSLYTPGISLTC